MKILAEILKKRGIKSKKDFLIFLSKQNSDDGFEVVREANIKEFETFKYNKENPVLQNMVFDIANIDFSNFTTITIKNCIFLGNITFFQKNIAFSERVNIEIENSIFLGDVLINKNKSEKGLNIEIYNSNFSYLAFSYVKAESVILEHSKIFMLYMDNIEIDGFDTENNVIEYLEVKEYKFEKVNFDFKQINKNHIKKRMKKMFFSTEMKTMNMLNMNMNLFEFIKFYNEDILKEKVHSVAMDSLVKFIKEETNITKDKKGLNELVFWELFFSQKNPAGKFFVWLTKAFIYPGRFLILGIIVLIIFSLIYTIPVMQFSTSGEIRSLNVFEALYFAGVTFTTIGYGDISPVGIARVASVLEGILGILTMNAFMVALLKKYVD